MLLNDIEYIFLRLVRKYLFSYQFLVKYGNFIPGYTITSAQFSPDTIIDRYLKFIKSIGRDIKDKTILELGVGVTSSTCYKLAYLGAKECYAFEPYVKFNKKFDDSIIKKTPEYASILNKVKRITDLKTLKLQKIDIILSNGVLEYVENFSELCHQLKEVMNSGACMIHRIDYRDHFFKYPFHFYKFNKKTWGRIGTGLSRLRVIDHLNILEEAGFKSRILDRDVAMNDFLKFKSKNKIHNDFERYRDEELATKFAVIFAEKT